MKKVLAAALICTASSFAAWDYFPVIEHGKGEAKIGYSAYRQGSSGSGGLYEFKSRYSPVANLELMSKYRGDARGNHVIGTRYQVVSILSTGLDLGVPIPSTAWSLTPNIQLSIPLTSVLTLGSNFETNFYTQETGNYTHGADLSTGIELDLMVGKNLVWFSTDINTGLTETKRNGNKIKPKDEGRGPEISPALGYVACLSNMSLGTNVGMAFGKDAGHDKFGTFIGMDFSVKF